MYSFRIKLARILYGRSYTPRMITVSSRNWEDVCSVVNTTWRTTMKLHYKRIIRRTIMISAFIIIHATIRWIFVVCRYRYELHCKLFLIYTTFRRTNNRNNCLTIRYMYNYDNIIRIIMLRYHLGKVL